MSTRVESPGFLNSIGRILATAVWFGMLCGLGEAAFYIEVERQGILDLLAGMVLFDCVMFLVVGILYSVAHRLCRRVFTLTGLVAVLVGLTVNSWARIVYTFPNRQWLLVLIVVAVSARSAYVFHRNTNLGLRLQRRTLPWMIAAVVVSLLVPVGRSIVERRVESRLPTPSVGRRNFVVIVVDTLRADHLSLYGYARDTSPNLARIAEQGVTFENAISASSWTLPSHASMVTGRYPHEHDTEIESAVLDGHLPMIGEEFQKLGYRTGAFSANNAFFNRAHGFGRGFQHFEDYKDLLGRGAVRSRYGARLNYIAYRHHWIPDLVSRRNAEEINRRALRWMDADSRPFFVFLNYIDVHEPYTALNNYGKSFLRPGHSGRRILVGNETPTTEGIRDEMDAYDECIRYVDAQIQRLLDELRKRGRDKETVVIITSDHGESFNEHGFMRHGNALYRELIHVPLIVWSPGFVPSGMRIDQPVNTTALPSTLLSLADAPPNASFRLAPLSELWTAPQREAEHSLGILSELAHIRGVPSSYPNSRGRLVSLTTPEWHLILGPYGTELYRCCENTIERENMVSTTVGHEVMPELTRELAAIRDDSGMPNHTPEQGAATASKFK